MLICTIGNFANVFATGLVVGSILTGLAIWLMTRKK